jgi:hypothetical protein
MHPDAPRRWKHPAKIAVKHPLSTQLDREQRLAHCLSYSGGHVAEKCPILVRQSLHMTVCDGQFLSVIYGAVELPFSRSRLRPNTNKLLMIRTCLIDAHFGG